MDELNHDAPISEELEGVNYDASQDEEMEERNHTEIIRDLDKVITVGGENKNPVKSYKYKILVRDKPALEGELSREEMNLIYNLYSNEGANLTQRAASRYFPSFAFRDFKKILRAFNITKDCLPFAPHVKEEHSYEQMEELYYQNKDKNFLIRLEQHRSRRAEQELDSLKKKYKELQDGIEDFSIFVSKIKFDSTRKEISAPETKNSPTLVLYLSDMHIGADVSKYSLYSNKFDYESAKFRMYVLMRKILEVAVNQQVSKIIICNMGDSIDGLNNHTTRGGHYLPQNMDNKEMFDNFVRLVIEFINDLVDCHLFSDIEYVAVEGGNHDGSAGYMANTLLENLLPHRFPGVKTRVFKRFMETIEVGKHTFILCHGKDERDMFKGLPLTLNDKAEVQINEFIDYNHIDAPYIHFVKGDLHQSATTYGKKFRYKSVASFFGSSQWIHLNFGNTKAAVDYDIVYEDQVFESRIVLN